MDRPFKKNRVDRICRTFSELNDEDEGLLTKRKPYLSFSFHCMYSSKIKLKSLRI